MPGQWTEETVEALRRLWINGRSASEIAVELGITSREAVVGKVCRMGLQRNTPGSSVKAMAGAAPKLPWSDEELRTLRALDGESMTNITGHLSRSQSAIYRKASELGVTIGSSVQLRLPAGRAMRADAPAKSDAKAPFLFGDNPSALPVPPTKLSESEVPESAVPWDQRTGEECSFPFGDARAGGLFCCPEPHVPGHSYCLHHATQPGLYAYRSSVLSLVQAA